ncbi:MAG: enoyl-CoA hydratase/isomerase [Rhodothalassiaceae bacterium]
MTYRLLTLEIADSVATITMNRPERLNALSDDLIAELLAAVTEAADRTSGARCLLLTGAGRGFSSGADLAQQQMSDGLPDLSAKLKTGYNPLISAMHDLPIPIVAAVNGPAAGAGMSLALAADFILAARSAYFLQAFVNIGLAPDAGATWFLPRLVGPARALELMLLGERLPADKAADWGLIHRVVDDGQLMTEARALAVRLAQGPTKSLAAIRRLARTSWDNDLKSQLAEEADAQKTLGYSKDFLAGIGAFLSKSAPKFRGE